ncbi:PREDICTED: flocculation protein FLO11-like [Amphimedon queenslandica]|uniref:Fibronectin type-III domain-containing protein n=1 Tax=Amphimedon queenslandica TaxID=400682 RepID=A0AAN0J9G5_AMPQE|nr:PREDICTED: flocculation protein FLO11-like [Amphimedon queenslandica]|eukprot:XP_019853664.1 PREDICTED: flocculation protein FLO11-like [Amphimedon queenslandica]
MKLFLTVMFLSCSLVKCTPEFNCPTSPLCINETVTYQCRVDTTGSANTLQWRVLNTTGGILGDTSYASSASEGSMGSIGTQFTTNLTSTSGAIVSDITFTATMDINNYTVQCRALDTNTPALVGTDMCSIILIEGILPAPIPNELMIDLNSFTFSWSPSTSPCLSHYNVNVTSIEYTISTTDTSLSLPVPSTNDTEYSISVVAVDTGGRYMSSKEMRKFIPDVPQSVTNFAVNQTYPDHDDDTAVNITVSWNKPPSSSRPNISSYIIYHNVTDPDTNITIPAPTTTYNIPDATVGSVYTVGVAAVNVLETGPIVSATISIVSIVVSTTIMTGLSSSMTVTPSSPSPSSSFMGATVTPITSSTPTNGTSTGGLDSTVYIGIGAGVAVIVIVILIILIIVGCLIWYKPCKGEKVQDPYLRASENIAYGKAIKPVE